VQRRYLSLLLLSILIIPITVIFTIMTVNDSLGSLDSLVQNWFSSWTSPILEQVMKGITFLAYTKMLALLSVITILWLFIKKKFYLILLYLTIMGGGIILTFIMKISIERERPGEITYIDFWGFGSELISYSFPSGHAVKGLLYFGFLINLVHMEIKKKVLKNSFTVLLTLLIMLIGIGQVMLERHFVTDVIGGFLVALSWLIICLAIIRPISIWNSNKARVGESRGFE
jgi:undecaprenyl-diphosphatase